MPLANTLSKQKITLWILSIELLAPLTRVFSCKWLLTLETFKKFKSNPMCPPMGSSMSTYGLVYDCLKFPISDPLRILFNASKMIEFNLYFYKKIDKVCFYYFFCQIFDFEVGPAESLHLSKHVNPCPYKD